MFDNSWSALLAPGKAKKYFTRPQTPAFEPQRTDYSPANAWWLAELSRLIYNRKKDVRRTALVQVGLRSVRFFSDDETQGFLVAARDDSFAALVFRGTGELEDWLVNLELTAERWPPGGRVHEGFNDALNDVWKDGIQPFLEALPAMPIFCAGHSLGAALATLAASRLAADGRPLAGLYTYGSPRVGDEDFAATLNGVPAFRVVNNRDVVTTQPRSLLHLKLVHVGELRYITHDNRVVVNPTDEEIEEDRKKVDETLKETVDRRRLFDPPQLLSDHTPVNYVTHLERELL